MDNEKHQLITLVSISIIEVTVTITVTEKYNITETVKSESLNTVEKWQ